MANLLNETKQYLDVVNKQPSLHTMTPVEVRELRAGQPKPLNNKTQVKNIEDQLIEVRDGASIKIRIYSPKGKGPFPIIIYYHGGGWVLNSIETCHESCQLLAAKTNSIVVSVDYRLAPEFPFPTPVYDAYDAFLWTVKNVGELNGVENQITVAGDSAGANLATVVSMMSRDLNGPTIASQFLLYPVTDLTYNTPSYNEFAEGFGLEKKDMEWFGHYYLQQETEKQNPYVAPLRAEHLNNLPPAFIKVAENDVLRDEGIAYAKRLSYSNVTVQLETAKGLIHSFFTKNEVFSEYIEKTIDQFHEFRKMNH
ncbi:alpha/beta hydrolase [Lysinibacillus composti]|uniref:Alpha/beta hydrolase n=2 Tax=Lysinibacillus composti TaxID=720633 RepID=A0A3N9ULS9_9BACI|nr:alpha/beta hydrolase [Lysinibacillus composti]